MTSRRCSVHSGPRCGPREATGVASCDGPLDPPRDLRLGLHADNAVDLVVDDIINYGDSILVIGKTRGLPLRARIVGGDPEACRRIGSGRVDVLVRPERVQLAGRGVPEVLSMKVTVTVNYGDSVLVIGDARGHAVRMRIAGAQPEAIREGATVTVGWAPGDAHLIPRASG